MTETTLHPEIEEMIEPLIKTARKNLERDGSLMGVCFLHNSNTGDTAICQLDMTSDMTKDMSTMGIRMVAKKIGANIACHLSEAWITLRPKDNQGEWIRPSQDPNRQEVVVIIVQTPEGHFIARPPIIREGGKPTFGEVKLESMHIEGRMTRMLG